MKFNVIVADSPYSFSDHISMSDTKRGAAANYNTMSVEELKSLPIQDITEDDAILCLWCPSSLLQEGLDIMKAWGFRQTQTHIWVKTKKLPFKEYLKRFIRAILESGADGAGKVGWPDINEVLAFGMGRLFRQSHELVLVGVRGKIYNHLENKSQRSVHFFPATKHSTKPELLQDMIDIMFYSGNKIELFARRQRNGWICVGNEDQLNNEDIRVSIDRLKNL